MAIVERSRRRAEGALAGIRRELDERASSRRALGLAAALVVVGAASAPWTGRHGLLAGALAGWIVGAMSGPIGLVAFAWAALLPIEVVRGVPPWVLDLARYGGVVVMVLRVPATASVRSGRWRTWAILLVGLGVARLAAAGVLRDAAGGEVAAVVLAGAVGALLVALRPTLLRRLFQGFLAGTTVSAVVVLLQVQGQRTIGGPLTDNLRYPGLSPQTSALTWPLALAVVVAVCSLLGLPKGLVPRWAGLVSLALCALALLASGAQGGFVGLAVAAVFTGRELWRAKGPVPTWVVAAVGLGGVLLVVAVLVTFDVDGFIPDKGFVNETSRATSWVDGARTVAHHPWVGVSDADYRSAHEVRPHSVVVEAAVAAGIAGAVLGVALVWQLLRAALAGRGQVDARVLGAALAAVLFADTFLEGGTFTGLNRVAYVLLAVAAIEEFRSLSGGDAGSAPLPVEHRQAG